MSLRCSRYLIAGQTTGRPRERLYLDEWRGAILDANDLRRQARDNGRDLASVRSVHVAWSDRADEQHEAHVEIATTPHALYVRRWWLLCPLCGSRRVTLFVGRRGPACRSCINLGHRRRTGAG